VEETRPFLPVNIISRTSLLPLKLILSISMKAAQIEVMQKVVEIITKQVDGDSVVNGYPSLSLLFLFCLEISY